MLDQVAHLLLCVYVPAPSKILHRWLLYDMCVCSVVHGVGLIFYLLPAFSYLTGAPLATLPRGFSSLCFEYLLRSAEELVPHYI